MFHNMRLLWISLALDSSKKNGFNPSEMVSILIICSMFGSFLNSSNFSHKILNILRFISLFFEFALLDMFRLRLWITSSRYSVVCFNLSSSMSYSKGDICCKKDFKCDYK
eukprot:190334_1